MEASSSCAQVVSSHRASLLMSLNLQRQQAQFCDCVVRQRLSPGQLYPAHRCVLAASSPVLASILSSSGALVELQEPCLSGSVLAHLMDYIYTGTLPYTRTQQCYYSLLAAAHYLQMDELLEALRAWQEANDSDVKSSCKDSVRTAASSRDKQLNRHSDKFEICHAVQGHLASVDSCVKGRETGINCANCCGRDDVKNESNCSSLSEDCTNNLNTVNCRQVTYVTPRELIQNVSHTTKVHGESKVDKEVQKNLFQSSGIVAPHTWQRSTEDERVSKVGDSEDSRYSFPSSSPHPCSGAVPVIRHSSRAATLQLARESTVPTQASVKSSRIPVPRSESTGSDSTVAGISTKHTNHIQHQDHRNWDNLNSSDRCSAQDFSCISGTDHPHILEQSGSSISADYFMEEDENIHHTQRNIHTEHRRDDLGLRNDGPSRFNRRSKHKTELRFDDPPSKHQPLDVSDSHGVSAEKLSQHQGVVVPLPVEKSEAESDPHYEDMCSADEEQSYSSKCPPEMDRRDLHSELCEPKKDWCRQLYKRETSTRDSHPDNRDTARGDKRNHCVVFTTPESASVDNDCGHLFASNHTSVEAEKMSENAEMCSSFPVSTDSEMCDPMYDVVGQSYFGHLHYHCLPQEDTHLLHIDSDHKHYPPSHPDYSDQTSDEEQDGTFDSSGQHRAAEATQQVLLLDISAKPAELLVSYKHRADEGEKTNDREQRNEVDEANNRRTPAKLGSESFVEGKTKPWDAETKRERDAVSKYQIDIIPGPDVTHNTGLTEKVSDPETVCSRPGVPDSLQDLMSSHSSVCIPSALSASMPRNISTHLSTPLHPFQCFLCDRSFSQRGSLNRHVRSHLGVRPFPCPCCPMTFSRQYRVTEHMRVHQRCPQGGDFPKHPASSM
ncbi:uncharacterized protein LOC131460023 [Solea solea]|uniref:uncharacterized protein LOC131460023 n=1 Tax=Solea solea TaxID=90069 RepID=UPI00272D0873|nr:uncharacterized protein LOC131460023 [Solea solea]